LWAPSAGAALHPPAQNQNHKPDVPDPSTCPDDDQSLCPDDDLSLCCDNSFCLDYPSMCLDDYPSTCLESPDDDADPRLYL
jgi:hypothetical protein